DLHRVARRPHEAHQRPVEARALLAGEEVGLVPHHVGAGLEDDRALAGGGGLLGQQGPRLGLCGGGGGTDDQSGGEGDPFHDGPHSSARARAPATRSAFGGGNDCAAMMNRWLLPRDASPPPDPADTRTPPGASASWWP